MRSIACPLAACVFAQLASAGGGEPVSDRDLLALAATPSGYRFVRFPASEPMSGGYGLPIELHGPAFKTPPEGLPDRSFLRERVDGTLYGTVTVFDRGAGELVTLLINTDRLDIIERTPAVDLLNAAAPEGELFPGENAVFSAPVEAASVRLPTGELAVFGGSSTGFSRTGTAFAPLDDPYGVRAGFGQAVPAVPLGDGLLSGGVTTAGSLASGTLGADADVAFLDVLTPTRGGDFSIVVYEPASGARDRLLLPEKLFEVSTVVAGPDAFYAVVPEQFPDPAYLIRAAQDQGTTETLLSDERFTGAFGARGITPLGSSRIVVTQREEDGTNGRLWSVDPLSGDASVLFEGDASGVHDIIDLAEIVSEPNPCIPDITTLDQNVGTLGFGVPDGTADVTDLTVFVEFWINNDPRADVTTLDQNPPDPLYGVPDGNVDVTDLTYFVEIWLAGCPD
ncbi:MAG: GC-type dockerin domain-anchored protein [Planctomycetota bacterium]